MINKLLYAKLLPHLDQSLNLACLENGKYDQIVAHFERKLKLSGLESDGELTIPTMTALPQMITNKTLNRLISPAIVVENQAMLSEIVVKR